MSVSADEELRRVLPVVERLVGEHGATVSVDTTKAEVARAALRAGATIVNDVSCGGEPRLLEAVAAAGARLVLMHNRGRGEVDGDNVRYGDVVAEVRDELLAAVERAVVAGVRADGVVIDPGVGFAKTAEQSMRLLTELPVLVRTGHPVLVGTSRKSFIAQLAPSPAGELPGPHERQGGTAATVTLAVLGGARAVRVHDVAPMRQAVRVALASIRGRAA